MTQKQKKTLLRILVSAVLLFAAFFLPIRGRWAFLVYMPSYLVVGYDVLWSALRNIINGQIFDEKFLMMIATLGAFGIGEYPEAVMVMLLYQLGEWFQSIAVGKSRKSIGALMDIRPDTATVLRNGEEAEVFPDEVAVGETILIRAGEKIPLDGIIIEGDTEIDTAAMTGESVPRSCAVGDAVISGTVNLTGLIKAKVTKSFEESTASKILELVENSAMKKAKSEKFITRFARYYTPCVVIGALLLAVVPSLIFGEWQEWIHRALIFLVVSCPCALVISVPLSFFGGIGGAARKGILIKGSDYLETLSKVKTVVFDKTGTLTQGTFSVSEIHAQNIGKEELLELAALAESTSNHPIAASIRSAYGKEVKAHCVEKSAEYAGKGLCAVVDGTAIYAGNEKIMELAGIAPPSVESKGTVVYLAREKEFLGYLVVTDAIKPDAEKAVDGLKKVGISKLIMLTGDLDEVGQAVGQRLGMDEIYTQLLPHQKVEKVEECLAEGTLAFVGDGVNDAPVLSRADVGIAMGALGSDAAIEAADIVLMDDKPSKIAEAIRISRKTMAIVKQNIVFSLLVKGLVLLLSALGFTSMLLAIFADVGVMVLAILNAMRALKND